MGNSALKDKFINYLSKDNVDKVKDMLENPDNKGVFLPNQYINKEETFTALNICACYGSIKCSELLIENNWTISFKENVGKNTSLMLACKYGHLNLVKLFIEKYKAALNLQNLKGMNILDISVLYQKYEIAYYLYKNLGMTLRNSSNEYKNLIEKYKIESFDVKTFYDSLINKVPPDNVKLLFSKKKNLKKTKTVAADQGNKNTYNTYEFEEEEDNLFGRNIISNKRKYAFVDAAITEYGFVEHDDVFYYPNVDLKVKKENRGNVKSIGYKLINN